MALPALECRTSTEFANLRLCISIPRPEQWSCYSPFFFDFHDPKSHTLLPSSSQAPLYTVTTVTTCSAIDGHQHFGGICCFHLQVVQNTWVSLAIGMTTKSDNTPTTHFHPEDSNNVFRWHVCIHFKEYPVPKSRRPLLRLKKPLLIIYHHKLQMPSCTSNNGAHNRTVVLTDLFSIYELFPIMM